jgi:hypothetical protein
MCVVVLSGSKWDMKTPAGLLASLQRNFQMPPCYAVPPKLSAPPIGGIVLARERDAALILKHLFDMWIPKSRGGTRGVRTPLIATHGAPGVGKSMLIDVMQELFGGLQVGSASCVDSFWRYFKSTLPATQRDDCDKFRKHLESGVLISITLNDKQSLEYDSSNPATNRSYYSDSGEQSIATRILHSYVTYRKISPFRS